MPPVGGSASVRQTATLRSPGKTSAASRRGRGVSEAPDAELTQIAEPVAVLMHAITIGATPGGKKVLSPAQLSSALRSERAGDLPQHHAQLFDLVGGLLALARLGGLAQLLDLS